MMFKVVYCYVKNGILISWLFRWWTIDQRNYPNRNVKWNAICPVSLVTALAYSNRCVSKQRGGVDRRCTSICACIDLSLLPAQLKRTAPVLMIAGLFNFNLIIWLAAVCQILRACMSGRAFFCANWFPAERVADWKLSSETDRFRPNARRITVCYTQWRKGIPCFSLHRTYILCSILYCSLILFIKIRQYNDNITSKIVHYGP